MQSNTQSSPAITLTQSNPVVEDRIRIEEDERWKRYAEFETSQRSAARSVGDAVLSVACFAGLVAFIGIVAQGIVSI